MPVTVTGVPTGPWRGENVVIEGAPLLLETVKFPPVWAKPLGVETVIGPVVAPLGTLVVICVPGPFTLNPAAVPLNRTNVVPTKFDPLIVTPVPTGPLDGLNPEMFGGEPAFARDARSYREDESHGQGGRSSAGPSDEPGHRCHGHLRLSLPNQGSEAMVKVGPPRRP